VGLERHLVADRRAISVIARFAQELGRADAPGAAVEIRHHRPAPVELVPRRRFRLEFGTERYRVRKRERADRPGRHRFRQPGHAGVGVLRQAPQRPLNAGKQEKQEQHHRSRLGEHATGRLQVLGQGPLRRAEPDERGGCDDHGEQHQPCNRDGLRIEEICERDEINEERHHENVARGARLQQLQE
jgi:hypothetical protein